MRLPTRVGVVGAGQIATIMHIPVLRAMGEVQVAWVADSDPGRARQVAQANRTPFAPLTRDISDLPPCDVVLLSIPLAPRRNYFDHYAATKTAILAEKPLAVDASEHRRVMTQFAPWQLAVGYQRRSYATSQLLRRLIRTGVFGALRGIRVAEGGRVTQTGGRGSYQDESVARGGGITKNLGCHSLDLAFWLTDARHATVRDRQVDWDADTDRRASAKILLTDIGGIAGQDCELEWTVSWLDAQPNTIELRFENATIRSPVAPDRLVDLLDSQGRVAARIETETANAATTSSQAFYLEWSDFLAGVHAQRAPEVSAESCMPAAILMDELLSR